ncbi:MAG: ornithine cyclodeaminase family protein [Acidobacteria bacterium]|nr:MAG: ornithine cyclodeaminase family protein [Acidobacteriota bacterium]
MPKLLTEADVRAALKMPALIDAMDGALTAFSAGRVTQPVRTVLEVGAEKNYFGVMPASIDDEQAVGAKLVTVYHGNHARGLASHQALIVLLNHATGELVALLDGRYITEARTAAVSAVSVRHLANKDASVLAILGSGVQARSHLEAIRHVRTLTEVRVWSPTAAKREAFAREQAAATGLPVRACASPSEATRGASIIALVTASKTPVIDSADVADGAHICAVGACRPDQREMTSALVKRARLFVDSRAAALKEAGEVLIPITEGTITESHLLAELGDVTGGQHLGRRTKDEVTVFKSLGLAVEDVIAAKLAVAASQDAKEFTL